MTDFRVFWSPAEQMLYEKIIEYPVDRTMTDHMTASAFVVDTALREVLFIYHKKYDSWSWLGGHWDHGELISETAIRELWEESGVRSQPFSDVPISIEKLQAGDHFHYNATFLFVINKKSPLLCNERETSGIRWFPLQNIREFVTEQHMLPIYDRIIARIKKINDNR